MRAGTRRLGARLAALVLAAAAAGVGADRIATAHMRQQSRRQDVAGVRCTNCHWVRTTRLAWARPRPHYASPAGLAVSPDGKHLYVSLEELDEVLEVDTQSRRVVRRAHVSGSPAGLALDRRGERLYVACRTGNRVAALETRRLEEAETAAVGLAPVAVAFLQTPAGDRLVVANAGSDAISVLAASPLHELGRLPGGREPVAVAPTADGSCAVVANRLARIAARNPREAVPVSEITVVDPGAVRVLARPPLESAHLSEGVSSVAGRLWVVAPVVRIRNLVPITQVAQGWVMSSGLAICDLEAGSVVQVPLDEANAYFADPSGIAVDPSGRRAYVASGGGDAVTVVDLDRLARWMEGADEATRRRAMEDLQLSAEYVVARIPTGANPRQVVLSPDGGTLYVAEFLGEAILVVETTTLLPSGRIELGDGSPPDPVRRGARVFHRASTSFQGQFSCRSCHPEGHQDGLTYDFDVDGLGGNIVDNRSLLAVAGTAPFKWNGKNPTLAIQCGPRFAKVLTRSEPISGQDLEDLVAFMQSLPPPPNAALNSAATRGNPLTPAQERGRELFFATRTNGRDIPRDLQCDTCHRPPLYTNRLSFAVGTRGPADSTDAFDTPHLLGLGSSAPYLHDGRAATLEEIWTVHNPNDLHGVTNHLTKHQLNDLIEFLKGL